MFFIIIIIISEKVSMSFKIKKFCPLESLTKERVRVICKESLQTGTELKRNHAAV